MGPTAAMPRSNFQALFRPSTDIYEEVSEGRQFDALYFSMLVFGCLIALLGLLLNSPAVIIGAMLISPLMGPILSCGLAMTLADGKLARKAGRNLGLSIVETILIAAIAAWLSPLKDVTPEILARTNPNLMDLLVAFFSGAAGTLALCSKRPVFTIVPGVAIATAVMPPLATIGYGISTRQWHVASGASMLFVTNLASIVVSADIGFLMVGIRRAVAPMPHEERRWWVRHRMAISWAILALLSIPLIKTLINAADQRKVRNEIRSTLAQKLNHPGTSRLDEVNVQMGSDLVSAEATVQTAKLILPNEENQIEQELSRRLGRKVVLHLDQIQLATAPSPAVAVPVGRDYVGGGKIRPPLEEAKLSPAEMLEKIRTSARNELGPILRAAGVDDFDLVSVAGQQNGELVIQLRGVYHDEVAAPDAWRVICAAVAQKLKLPVRLAATMFLPQSKIQWIQYRATNVHPASSEFRKAQRALAAWKKQGLEHEFIARSDADAKLFSRRVEYLESRLGPGLNLPDGEAIAAVPDSAPANSVGVAAAQSIEITSAPATVGAPVTTSTPVSK